MKASVRFGPDVTPGYAFAGDSALLDDEVIKAWLCEGSWPTISVTVSVPDNCPATKPVPW